MEEVDRARCCMCAMRIRESTSYIISLDNSVPILVDSSNCSSQTAFDASVQNNTINGEALEFTHFIKELSLCQSSKCQYFSPGLRKQIPTGTKPRCVI